MEYKEENLNLRNSKKSKKEQSSENELIFLESWEIEELDKIKERKADSLEIIKWVFDNMLMKVSPKDAISVGAYCYLKRCQNDAVIQSEFYKNIWPKILPKIDVIQEHEEELKNEGRTCIHAIDRVLSICNSVNNK